MAQQTRRARNIDRSRDRSRSPSIWTIQEEPEHPAILRVLPPDSRNWMVLEVAPRLADETPVILKLKITLPSGAKKTLELVRQTGVLTVNVNPDPHGFDEWTVGGQTFYVKTDPQASEERSAPDPAPNALEPDYSFG